MYFRHAPLAKIRSSASKKTPTPPLPRTCGGRDCASDVYGMIMARAARVAADNFIGIPLNGRARIGGGNGSGFREVAVALAAGEGTAWLWARTEMAGAVDVLVIVEAGQMSRANGGGRRVNPRDSGSPTRHGEPLAVRRPLEKHGPSGALRVSLGEWIVFVAPLDLLVFVIPLDVPRSSCAPDVRS